MKTLNKIEYEELKNKINEVNDLTTKVENNFKKIDNIITENINTGKGIWDGEEAQNFKNEWSNLKENIPNIVDIYKKQAQNIENVLEMTTIE